MAAGVAMNVADIRWLAVDGLAREMRKSNPEWRRGQSLFNALCSVDKGLAEQIRGTAADPFNDDSRIGAFDAALMAEPPLPESGRLVCRICGLVGAEVGSSDGDVHLACWLDEDGEP